MMQKLSFILALLFLSLGTSMAQTSLKGVVKDAEGSPLYGVNVTVQGTTKGTITSDDGSYSIEVDKGQTLNFSYIGFKSQSVVIQNQTVINITMESDDQVLSEVVVTALGIDKEKEKLGYSVTEVGSDALSRARETNVANSLSGRVAGLVVKGTSSGPGGTSKITLRGLPSISGTGSPLYVIDGVPMDNSQRGAAGQWGGSDNGDGIGNLSPDDIEKMTVLKGQSASALYGSRASNGVILITTKKGDKGGGWSVNYNLNLMTENPIDYTDFQDQYGQGNGGNKPTTAPEAQSTGRFAWGAKMDGSQVIGFDGNQYPYSPAANNYLSFYRNGTNLTNTISATKGYNGGSFRLSLSNLNAKSIVPSSDVKRTSLNLNVVQDITDKLNITAMVNYLNQHSDNVPNLSDGPKNPNNFLFLAPNIDPSIFSPGYDPATGFETVFSDDIYVTNPYFVVNKGINDLDRQRTISSLAAKYSFTPQLYAQVRLGNDTSNDKFFTIEPSGLAYTSNYQGNLNARGQSQTSEMNLQAVLAGNWNFAETIQLDALVGGNIRNNKYERVSVGGSSFVLPNLYSPFNVQTFSRAYDYNEREVHSGFYSVGLGVKDWLNLTTTGRYDVYSTLPIDNNSIFSPSVSAAFLFGKFLNIRSLDFAKLRASYAVTSGEPFAAYATSFYYSSGNAFNGVPTGSSPTALPNLFLKPFTTDEVELGLELNFYKKRLNFDLAFFNKKTHNEIMNASYSIASGFSSAVVATGSTQNTGLEVLVSGTPIKTQNFSWTTSLNLTKVKNKVLSTDNNNNPVNLGQTRGTLGNAVTAYVVGKAGPQIRAYDYAYNSDGSIQVDESGLPVRGELKDYGTVLPTLYGGWNNQFNYKNFNLAFLIDYNFGNKVLSATEFYSIFRGLNQITLDGREGGVTHDGKTASAEDYYKALAQNITSTSIVSGDFIKFRQVSLGYTVPSKVFNGVPVIGGVSFSLVARNLGFLMRKAKNIDPEASFGSTINYTGIEGTNLPSTRSLGFNLNIKLN
ncbi:SusC/RagA family TonB-linked outer membrane protein [Marinilongibacter aquaticus]|uniref:SusC/RagA family TonB-linked outer membrane protein n=1 Tax=Marinilongibacter aquaticus TaxID=2975157 RepID=UPI00286EA4EF|nr:SusC/RagA family TonB-linked outer membrane protein [Marinilongibacter aquaticus]